MKVLRKPYYISVVLEDYPKVGTAYCYKTPFLFKLPKKEGTISILNKRSAY